MSDLRSDREPDTQPDAITPPKTDDQATSGRTDEIDSETQGSESRDAGIGEVSNRATSPDL